MLRVEQISKTYNPGRINETCLFNGFSFHVLAQQFVTVVGSNGSGKSSLFNMIYGTLLPDAGKIFLNGQDITMLSEHQRAKRIGRVFQDPAKGSCPAMTILENMALADNKGKSFGLGFGIDKKRIDYYKTHLEKLKLGLENKINVNVGSLSGGQRQALALLLATKAPLDLLILDEHTAALDPKACETVMELTNRIVRDDKVTTIMVTHNLKYALDYGDRLVMLHQGGIVLERSGDDRKSTDMADILDVFHKMHMA